jgi:predicted metal-dependent peptidase
MFMNSTCRKKEQSTWRRPNRRFLHQDVIMPTLQGNSINEAVIARDTSGSMFFKDRLRDVTSEILGIVKAVSIDKIHFIDWDGQVESHEIYSSDELTTAPAMKTATGGGGTDPTCVSDYLKEKGIKPDCVIMLTDGEISNWGNWTVPILWAITNDRKITAPVGKTIQID